MEIRVNGKTTTTGAATLADLLVEIGLEPDQGGIAVAVNDEVVSKSRWPTHAIRGGDTVEVVGAVQGG